MPRLTKHDLEALAYHEKPSPGKIQVVPTTKYASQRDLALAYSPGVAAPCLAIEKNLSDAYKYTAKGNLVAVVTNGTAVLGLRNIGAAASIFPNPKTAVPLVTTATKFPFAVYL